MRFIDQTQDSASYTCKQVISILINMKTYGHVLIFSSISFRAGLINFLLDMAVKEAIGFKVCSLACEL